MAIDPAEVRCAAGSRTLASALAVAWQQARINAVEVGKACSLPDGITKYPTEYRYSDPCNGHVPFPADRHYEAKAWEIMARKAGFNGVLFWM